MFAYITEIVRLGLGNLALHKLRSVLTSLGIILGVAAVIVVWSLVWPHVKLLMLHVAYYMPLAWRRRERITYLPDSRTRAAALP